MSGPARAVRWWATVALVALAVVGAGVGGAWVGRQLDEVRGVGYVVTMEVGG